MYKITIRDDKRQHYINAVEVFIVAKEEDGMGFVMIDASESLHEIVNEELVRSMGEIQDVDKEFDMLDIRT